MKMDFNHYRKWFNQLFSLQVDGKFKGLSTLLELIGSLYFERFCIKVRNAMEHARNGYLVHASSLRFVIAGHKIVLRDR